MEVILLKKVVNLGVLGEKVKVRPGYARNYLIPGGFALPATVGNLKAFEARRAELERIAEENISAANNRKAQLENLQKITIAHRAGDEGRLFGSVGTVDIATAITNAGCAVHKSEVRLPAGPFRALGEYEVTVHLHPEVDAAFKIAIISKI